MLIAASLWCFGNFSFAQDAPPVNTSEENRKLVLEEIKGLQLTSLPKTDAQWLSLLTEKYWYLKCPKNTCLFTNELEINKLSLKDIKKERINLSISGYAVTKNQELQLPILFNKNGNIFKPIEVSSTINHTVYGDAPFIKLTKNGMFKINLVYAINSEQVQKIQTNRDYPIVKNNLKNKDMTSNGGEIFLNEIQSETAVKPQQTHETRDALEVKIYRLIEDNQPMRLTTRVDFLSSKERKQISLGALIPKDFNVSQINSNQVGLEYVNNNFLVDLPIGSSSIDIGAVSYQDVKEISLPSIGSISGAELVAVSGNQAQRSMSILGNDGNAVEAIDPSVSHPVVFKSKLLKNKDDQASEMFLKMPDIWSQFNTFYIKNPVIKLQYSNIEKDTDIENKIQTSRQTWIGFSENPLQLDEISFIKGNKQGKQVILNDFNPEGVSINQNPVIIFKDKDEKTFNMPNYNSSLSIIGSTNDKSELKKNILEADNTINNWAVYLAPGNKLWFYSGAERIDNSWSSYWSLYTLFGLALISIGFYRIFNPTIGIISAVSIILNLEYNIIAWVLWPVLLVLLALLKTLLKQKAEKPIVVKSDPTDFVVAHEGDKFLEILKIILIVVMGSLFLFNMKLTVNQVRYIINPSLPIQPIGMKTSPHFGGNVATVFGATSGQGFAEEDSAISSSITPGSSYSEKMVTAQAPASPSAINGEKSNSTVEMEHKERSDQVFLPKLVNKEANSQFENIQPIQPVQTAPTQPQVVYVQQMDPNQPVNPFQANPNQPRIVYVQVPNALSKASSFKKQISAGLPAFEQMSSSASVVNIVAPKDTVKLYMTSAFLTNVIKFIHLISLWVTLMFIVGFIFENKVWDIPERFKNNRHMIKITSLFKNSAISGVGK